MVNLSIEAVDALRSSIRGEIVLPGDSNYDAAYVMNVHGRWDDPTDDQNVIGWAREFFAATTEFASGSVYVNFVTDDEPDRIAAAYGPNHERLAKIKAKYDPDNLFRTNQNIRPAV